MTLTRRLLRPRTALLGLFLLALLPAIGCYNSNYQYVQGAVRLNGQYLTGGTVVFTTSDGGSSYSAPIESDGAYSTTESIPDGTYTVTLFNPQAPLPGVIPDRYASASTSGLSLDTTNATAIVNYYIDLTP